MEYRMVLLYCRRVSTGFGKGGGLWIAIRGSPDYKRWTKQIFNLNLIIILILRPVFGIQIKVYSNIGHTCVLR